MLSSPLWSTRILPPPLLRCIACTATPVARVRLSSIITMNTSHHPYRIHSSSSSSPFPSSPLKSPSPTTHTSSLPPSPSLPSYPIPSHLTTHSSPNPSTRSFTLMQYNILAGNLGTPEHFPFAKPHLLHWPHRRAAIVDKIKAMLTPSTSSTSTPTSPPPPSSTSSSPSPAPPPSPDSLPTFLCFQELTDYWTYFEPQLSALGYSSIYVKRPSLHVSNWSGTEKHDGCMVAYQSGVVERVVDVEQINYDDAHDRVALLVLLEWKEKVKGCSPYVLLATTHLYWDAKRLSVQVNELDHLLTSIGRMQAKWTQAGVEDGGRGKDGEEGGGGDAALPIPTVIAGDFNNGPSSQIYSRVVAHHTFHPLKTSRPAVTAAAAATSSSSSPSSSSSSSSTSPPPPMRHWLYRYDSSYAASGKEPPCTSVTNRRCWTIDYIFYSQAATLLPLSAAPSTPPAPHPLLRVTHTVPIPSEEELRSEEGPVGWSEDPRLKKAGQIGQGIPNSKQPSDHVPLLARFELVPVQQVEGDEGV